MPTGVIIGLSIYGVGVMVGCTTTMFRGKVYDFDDVVTEVLPWFLWPFLAVFAILTFPYWLWKFLNYCSISYFAWRYRDESWRLNRQKKKIAKARKLVEEVKKACPQT
jgi:hypothetical protein